MLATINQSISTLNTEYVQPSFSWCKRHKLLVSTIALSVLTGAICYKSEVAYDLMKKNIKYLTVVLPIAYTLPLPLISFMISVTLAGTGGSMSYETGKMLEAYTQSIVRVWQAWFKFVGISAA